MGRILDNKVAIITGGACGIGRAASMEFAKQGAEVVIFDIDQSNAAITINLLSKQGYSAHYIPVDVSSSKSVQGATKDVTEKFGRIDCAFNNAGTEGGELVHFREFSEEHWDKTININLKGTWLCMKYQLEQMELQNSGAIVNTSSMLGVVARPSNPAYTASKHGVIGLTKSAALAFAEKNIRVNAICPGFVNTGMVGRILSSEMVSGLDTIVSNCPMKRIGEPEEIAKAAAWLCSEKASYITGHALVIDGGMVAA